MPRTTLAPCSKPGCPTLTEYSYCDEHTTAWAGSTRRSRLPKDWRSKRQPAVLRRDKHRCYKCGGRATQVDHLQAGDDHRMSNLAAICDDCHKAKSSEEGNAARWGWGAPSPPPS